MNGEHNRNEMSAKYSRTTADYLTWDQNLNLIRKTYDDENFKISLLISVGSFLGMRISDILSLRWEDILDKDDFVLKVDISEILTPHSGHADPPKVFIQRTD